jgi:hypothetical protein
MLDHPLSRVMTVGAVIASEAKQSRKESPGFEREADKYWIASSLTLLAMTE